MFSNAALAIAIQNLDGMDRTKDLVAQCVRTVTIQTETWQDCVTYAISQSGSDLKSKQSAYFQFILWSTFGLSMIRFLGVSALLSELVSGCWLIRGELEVSLVFLESQSVPLLQTKLDALSINLPLRFFFWLPSRHPIN